MLTYLDGGSGIAGDMLLGALIGIGLSPRELERILTQALGERGWGLRIRRTERQKWPAWSVTVRGDRPYGSLQKMRSRVRRAALAPHPKKHALSILDRLEDAERQAHGKKQADFDPNGLGLLDTLIDVVGNSWALWKLGIDSFTASALNTGRVAPATAYMLQEARVPVYSSQSRYELATPTGVAILLEFAKEFKPMPELRLEKTGYGAGSQDLPGRANVLGIYQGKPLDIVGLESVMLLETVIDDMDPRLYPHVMDLLLQHGALDAWWTPIGMKKGRPGIALAVLCRPEDERYLTQVLFRETTTLGIRRLPVQRWTLPRRAGGLRKIASLPGGRIKQQIEFEAAKRLAAARAIPLLKLLK
jgi:uncharacterized protein (TIGR00299 family) protein